ncbi:MAG: hypothetical protein IKP32_02705 [Clostridia bacterium]|nr:hypothetical protein [Clostridia bacterium]
MENSGASRKKSRDTWKKRGLFALVSNRPDNDWSGAAQRADPLPGDDDFQPDDED